VQYQLLENEYAAISQCNSNKAHDYGDEMKSKVGKDVAQISRAKKFSTDTVGLGVMAKP